MQTLNSIEEFNQIIASETVSIAVFKADWCPDCLYFDKFFPEVEEEFKDKVNFIYVDRDKFIELCEKYDILGIPSLVAYKNSNLIDSFISKARKTKEEVIQFLNEVIK